MAKTDWDGTRDTKKKEFSDLVTKQADESIENVNKTYDDTIAIAEEETAKKIDETTDDYVDILRSAGIQKELDLRDIQETRANMGLSRSGLSATEQTAAILSAGNKTAEAQRNRQKAIDSLNDGIEKFKREAESKRAADILKIEQQRDTDIFNNDQKWDNWAFEGKEAEKAANDTNLVTARTAGLIDDETLQLARDNGWSYEEAIKHYAPTKATNDYNNTILGWVQSGSISPELYQKIMKERPSLEDATLWAIEEQNQRAQSAAKIESQQKGAEAKQKVETNRVNGLYEAKDNGLIGEDTLNYAYRKGLDASAAVQHENKWKAVVEQGLITEEEKLQAWEKGYSIDEAVVFYPIKRELDNGNRKWAAKLLHDSSLPDETADRMAMELGLSEEDFKGTVTKTTTQTQDDKTTSTTIGYATSTGKKPTDKTKTQHSAVVGGTSYADHLFSNILGLWKY